MEKVRITEGGLENLTGRLRVLKTPGKESSATAKNKEHTGLQGTASVNLEVRWSDDKQGPSAKKVKLPQRQPSPVCLSGGVSALHCEFAASEDTEIRTQRHSWKQLRQQELGL